MISDDDYLQTPGDYLHRLPPPSWRPPAGKVLAHNHVYPVADRPGSRGSRCWLQPPGAEPQLEPCGCGWAPELGPHYRVRLPRG